MHELTIRTWNINLANTSVIFYLCTNLDDASSFPSEPFTLTISRVDCTATALTPFSPFAEISTVYSTMYPLTIAVPTDTVGQSSESTICGQRTLELIDLTTNQDLLYATVSSTTDA